MNKARLFSALTLLCGMAFASTLSSQAPIPANAIAPPPGFDIAAEMNALYGNYDTFHESSYLVESHSAYRSDSPNPITVSQKLDIQILFLAAVPDSDNKQVLLVTFAVPDGDIAEVTCHACSTGIGAALFEKDAAGWVLKASQQPSLIAGEYGQPSSSFMFGEEGNPGDASLVKFGPRQYGVKLEGSGTHGGRNYAETALFLPWDGKFVKAFNRLTMEDSSGPGCVPPPDKPDPKQFQIPCYAYRADLRFVPGKNSEYYDLVVETAGTKWGAYGSDVVSADGTEQLQFMEGEYR